jgi:hypothetical protein
MVSLHDSNSIYFFYNFLLFWSNLLSLFITNNGCGLSQWYDPPFSQFVMNMFGTLQDGLLELRERVHALKKEADSYNEQKQELQGSLEDIMKNLSMK